jgi:predicted MFS family arabinose efflux permease
MIRALALIVLAQFLGTSSWFSGNSAAGDLARLWDLSEVGRGLLLTSVQVGFIVGTLAIALSGLADAFPSSRIFTVSAVSAAANAGFALLSHDLASAAAFRFATGLALAGVYPLGMKLVVCWAPQWKGPALGWLVGALTVGTASPHLIRALGENWPWQTVVLASSGLTVAAGAIIAWLGDGPNPPLPAPAKWGGVLSVFRIREFRSSALGYFGHMWELYAFWFLAPRLVETAIGGGTGAGAIWSFAVIGIGGIGCVLGGMISQRRGSHWVAAVALAVSGICCLAFPFLINLPAGTKFAILLVWGLSVVADSPQFSAISARACPTEQVGAALAVQNGIGFAITVVAIQFATWQWPDLREKTIWLLAPGPILGLIGMMPLFRPNRKH